jgi:hypothetical protein
MKNKIMTILTFTLFIFSPFMAFGVDMWSETPDLFDDSETPSLEIESVTFNNMSPAIDMWAETPNLQTDNENHDVIIDSESRLVAGFDPEMYAETPDLNAVFSAQKDKTPEDWILAGKK